MFYYSISDSNMFVSRPQVPCYMALDGFSALLFVPSAGEVLAKMEQFNTTFCHLILRLELSHYAS